MPAQPPPLSPAPKPEPANPIAVEIYDGVYHLRGTDPAHLELLAGEVDRKMRAVAASGFTVDSLRVAVLAALNLADELHTLRVRHDAALGSLRQAQAAIHTRTGSLAGLLDEVLEDRKAG